MKKLILSIGFLFIIQLVNSQVGINTIVPDAQLDIKSSNQATPANTDGILIPKIDAFPLVNPTAAQNSMMVYLTTLSAGKQPGFYYWDSATTSWKGIDGDKGWKLTGNSGTNPSINFIGTTDNNDVIFRRNNVQSGKLSTANTSFGVNALNLISIGINNLAIGNNALSSNANANKNIAIGNEAMAAQNFSNGGISFDTNNIAIGNEALRNNNPTTFANGSRNLALGSQSLYTNTTGSGNVAIGEVALYGNITGDANVGIGIGALKDNISGNDNIAIGKSALIKNTTGSFNSAYSSQALALNTIGSGNIAHGFSALLLNDSGNFNSAIGYQSMQNNTTGSGNVAIGQAALYSNNIGANNTSLGKSALYTNTTGSNNIGIGANAEVPNSTANNQLSIGNVIYGADMSTTALGKIGIGVLVPTEKLEVAGKTKTTNLQVTTGAGTGKILTSDAVGNAIWQNPTSTNDWTTTGNAGTNAATNFIGTTDNQPLIFKSNNLTVGRIDSGVLSSVFLGGDCGTSIGGYYNVGIGYTALKSLTTGTLNVGIGLSALEKNSSGFWNTAIGANAMAYNLSGNNNVGFGYGALFKNETGSNNTANGFFSLENNKTGSGNVGFGNGTLSANQAGSNGIAIGKDAMYYSNSTLTPFDNNNIAIGFESLKGSTTPSANTGNNNTAIGYQTLLNNTTGNNNVVAGASCLLKNTTGNGNVVAGNGSLFSNTTGSGNTLLGSYILTRPTQGSNATAIGFASLFFYGSNITTVFENTNTAIGFQSMYGEHFGSLSGTNNNGLNNSVVGYNSLEGNSSGSNNTAIGYQTMLLNKTGNNNVAIGQETLNNNILGSGNVALGYQAGFNETGSNKLYIENSNSATPLIYGEFNNDLARINGNFRVNSTTVAGDEMQVKNSNLYVHPTDANVNLGTGGGSFMVSTQDSSPSFGQDTGGVYGDGNAVTIWSPGDANGGQPAAIVYFVDEDSWIDNNTNPYDNTALKSYINTVGALVQISDKNKKENIVKIENALEKVNQISGYTYQFKLASSEIQKGDKPIKSSGVLAQELEKVLPEAVQKSENGDYFVDYAAITPLLIEAIKSQSEKIKALETINTEILKRLEKLENK